MMKKTIFLEPVHLFWSSLRNICSLSFLDLQLCDCFEEDELEVYLSFLESVVIYLRLSITMMTTQSNPSDEEIELWVRLLRNPTLLPLLTKFETIFPSVENSEGNANHPNILKYARVLQIARQSLFRNVNSLVFYQDSSENHTRPMTYFAQFCCFLCRPFGLLFSLSSDSLPLLEAIDAIFSFDHDNNDVVVNRQSLCSLLQFLSTRPLLFKLILNGAIVSINRGSMEALSNCKQLVKLEINCDPVSS